MLDDTISLAIENAIKEAVELDVDYSISVLTVPAIATNNKTVTVASNAIAGQALAIASPLRKKISPTNMILPAHANRIIKRRCRGWYAP